MGKPKDRRKRDAQGIVLPAPGTRSTRELITDIVKIAKDEAEMIRATDAEEWGLADLVNKARRGYVIEGVSKEDIALNYPSSGNCVYEFAARVYSLLVEGCLPRLALVAGEEEKKYRAAVDSSVIPADTGEFVNLSSSSQISEETRKLEEELRECQKEVIQLQKRVIELQDTELSTVKQVTDTVQKDLTTWSAVVTRNCEVASARRNGPPPVRKPQQKKQEEDRSRNLMVFGLPEVEGEEDLSGLMGSLNEKPIISRVARVGTPREGKARPIVATLASREMLLTVLRKAPELKKTTDFSEVYLGPDRSWEERIERRRTLETLGKLRAENPSRNYGLRRGMIECRQRDPAP